MNFPPKRFENNKDAQINLPNKVTALNPNAAEFVPSALRSTYGINKSSDASRVDSTGTSGKAVLDRSESAVSNNSDDEAHQYWRCQLPDDITPDFKVMGEDELLESRQLSLVGLSIHDGIETSRFSSSIASETFGTRQDRSPLGIDKVKLSGNLGYSSSTYSEDQSSAAFMTLAANSWDKQFINGDQQRTNGMEGHHYNGDSGAGFVNNLLGDQVVIENAAVDPVEFLASQFPGFSSESLAGVYYASGCDMNLTNEMLGQLELQGDGGFSQNLNSEALNAPSLSTLDFQALPMADAHNGLSKYTRDLQQAPNTYRSTSSLFRGASDFASTVRKNASQDSNHWKYERNGSADGIVGSSRSSQLLASSYNGHGKLLYGDKSQSFGASLAAPVWLETGEAVANMYSESREETHDFARLRNACFEQASQAYLIGNKALARELSEKGNLYNMQMKAAHLKAGETIYRQRNPMSSEPQGYSRGGHDRLIDLHGLHVSEALHVLKHELSILRTTARSSGQRLQAMIFVGTGHHTKGARTPPRLSVAVEQFLLKEGLRCTQPQPGLLHVVIY